MRSSRLVILGLCLVLPILLPSACYAVTGCSADITPRHGDREQDKDTSGEPIVVESGVLRERVLAYSYPSKGMPFTFTYEYRSDRHEEPDSSPYILGMGFRHNHQIEFEGSGPWTLWLGLEKIKVIYYDPLYKTAGNVFITVEKVNDKWRVTTKNHIRYDFNSDDQIETITNLHNNYTFQYSYYTYGNSELLDKVVDSAGRWIRFYYGGDTLLDYVYFDDDKDAGTNVAADAGELKFVQFTYKSGNRLWKATDEAGKTTTYTYDGNIDTALIKKDLPRETGQNYQVNWGIEGEDADTVVYNHTDAGVLEDDEYFAIDFLDRSGTGVTVKDSNGHVTEYTFGMSWDTDFQGPFLRRKVYKEKVGESYEVLRVFERVEFHPATSQCTLARIMEKDNDATYVVTWHRYYGNDTDYSGNLKEIAVRKLPETDHIKAAEPADLTIAYNNDDRPTQIQDAEGVTRYFEYNTINGLDIVLKETYIGSEKDKVQYSYYTSGSSNKLLKGITDPEGNYTEFVYDSNGLVTEICPPIVGKITYAYTGTPRIGLPTSISYPAEDGSTQTVSFTYNNYGQAVSITYPTVPDEQSRSVVFSYDNAAQLTKVEQKYGSNVVRKIEYEYDTYLNLLTRTLETLSTSQDTKTEFSYDLMGNLEEIKDALNHKTEYTYDGMDRVKTRTIVGSEGSNQWSYTYNPDSTVATVTDPNGKTTTYTYGYDHPDTQTSDDELNVLKEIEYHDSSKTQFTYRQNSQLLTAAKSSDTVTFGYDSLGRVTSVDGVIGETPDRDTVEYVYRANSTLLASLKYNLDSEQEINYAYNSLNQLATITYDEPYPQLDKITTYTYSLLTGNLLKTTLPNGATANYTYDILGRLTRLANMASPDDVLDSYSYRFSDKGLRSRVTYADGRYTDYAYDSLYRLTEETQKTAQGATIHRLEYILDKVGNRTAKRYYYSPYDYNSVSYSYNDYNQLTSVTGTGGDKINVTGTVGDTTSGIESVVVTSKTPPTPPPGNQIIDQANAEIRGGFFIARGLTLNSGENRLEAQATDEAGNETTVQNHVVHLRKSFTNGVEYHYDNNGNLTEREDKDDEETTYYYYNLQNQLEFVDYHSGYDVQYSYDPIGRKYMAQYGTFSDSPSPHLDPIVSSLTRKYVYAGGVVIAELDNDNDLVKEYVRGLSLGGGIGGILYCKDDQSDFYYYHYDGSGNVTSITDDDGDEVAIYEYDAFGNILTEAGSLSNEFKFTTKQADSRGQLIDFGFRCYDPEVGRWTQRDPIGVVGGLNLYAYCNANPPNLVDPWGLQWWQEGGGRRDQQNCGRRGKPVFQTPVPGGWSVSYEDLSQEFFSGANPPFDVPIVTPPEPEPTVFEDLAEGLRRISEGIEHMIPYALKGLSQGWEHGVRPALGKALGAGVVVLEYGTERAMCILAGAVAGGGFAHELTAGTPYDFPATVVGGAVGAFLGAIGAEAVFPESGMAY